MGPGGASKIREPINYGLDFSGESRAQKLMEKAPIKACLRIGLLSYALGVWPIVING